MSEVTIPKEKMDYAIDLFITMVVEEIAELYMEEISNK